MPPPDDVPDPASGAPRVAIATAAEMPELDAEGRLLLAALRDAGVTAAPAVWDDPAVDWAAFGLVVIRSTWDYVPRREAFLSWAEGVAARGTPVANPPAVLRWTTDKRYLADLAAAGLPVVPSTLVEPGARTWVVPEGECVVKPTVSAGSKDTARYAASDHDRRDAHVLSLLQAGRTVLLQPYLDRVDDAGETAVVAFDGEVSHAIRKGPLLERGAGLVEGLFAPEEIEPRTASEPELEVARAAFELVVERFGAAPLYARVDLLADADDEPRILELELAEPSLFLDHAEGAPERLAAAVRGRLG